MSNKILAAISSVLLTVLPLAAFAQQQPAHRGEAGGILSMLPIFVIMILVFYFLLIRPQSKRAKEHQALLTKLDKGDEVLTSGGIYGKISRIDENIVVLTVSDSVHITIQKSAIVSTVPKGSIQSL